MNIVDSFTIAGGLIALVSTVLIGFVKAEQIKTDPDQHAWPENYRGLKMREAFLLGCFSWTLIFLGPLLGIVLLFGE